MTEIIEDVSDSESLDLGSVELETAPGSEPSDIGDGEFVKDLAVSGPESLLSSDSSELLRISGIMQESIVDGPGIRYVVFTQGCPHRCKGCHNPQTHDFNGGNIVEIKKIIEDIDRDPLIAGVTFSGGEPVCQASPLTFLAQEVKARGLDLMLYSGYTYEELLKMAGRDSNVKRLLDLADKLVDGPFVLEERDLTLPFRGSRNQRYIDLVKTRESGVCTEFISDSWDVFGM